jgi:DNA-binding response OmpR family regulator
MALISNEELPHMRVLVVDDEEMIVEYLKRSLILDGHKVGVAYDGAEGLKKAQTGDFDAVVLDVIMPHKDGLEVCRELREQGMGIPIIILSTKNSVSDRIAGLDSGADDYLIKPFTYAELAARLRALQRRPKDLIQKVVTYGDVSVDSSKRVVMKNGVAVDVTPKEFELLEYLLQHSNRAVSKEELLQKIWDVQGSYVSNRVEVCIKSLRQKLGDNSTNKPLIKTIRNFGYTVEAIV